MSRGRTTSPAPDSTLDLRELNAGTGRGAVRTSPPRSAIGSVLNTAPSTARTTQRDGGSLYAPSLFIRLSDLRQEDLNEDGTGKTFGDRERRLRELADRWGWQVVKVVVENDVDPKTGKARPASAFKRSKVTLPDGSTVMRVIRPGYRGILRDLQAGVANGLLAEDLDRVLRGTTGAV